MDTLTSSIRIGAREFSQRDFVARKEGLQFPIPDNLSDLVFLDVERRKALQYAESRMINASDENFSSIEDLRGF